MILAPDVDLYAINPDLTLDLALDTFLQFVRRGDFFWFGFGDMVRAKPAWDVPAGYFLGMSREFRATHWKTAVLFTQEDRRDLLSSAGYHRRSGICWTDQRLPSGSWKKRNDPQGNS